METRDLIVLGSGPGGYVAAIRAAQLGRKVTIVEKENLGGVCLNWGCIPSKALLHAAKTLELLRTAPDQGFHLDEIVIDFPKIMDRSRTVAARLSKGVSYLMKKNKIEVLPGFGQLVGNQQLQVQSAEGTANTFSYNDIILAPGARPRLLPEINVDGEVIHTSRTLLENRRLPQRLLIIGAGAIGIEFAYFFNTLGVQVTVVEALNQILPLEDEEISQELQRIFTARGLTIKTGVRVESLKCAGKTAAAVLHTADGEERWTGDACLVAIGTIPNTEEIGAETVGLQLERGFIKVDDKLRTNLPHHYAIGDATGGPLLAHKASHEGLVASEVACGSKTARMHYDNIPACTYCQPQVGSVGLTEQAARERGLPYQTAKLPFAAIGKAVATDEVEGFVKVLLNSESGELIGLHIIQAEATELITQGALIRSHEGITASVLETIFPHPTLSEAVLEGLALAAGRPINF